MKRSVFLLFLLLLPVVFALTESDIEAFYPLDTTYTTNDFYGNFDCVNNGITFGADGADFESTESDFANCSSTLLRGLDKRDFTITAMVKLESLPGPGQSYDVISKERLKNSTFYFRMEFQDQTSNNLQGLVFDDDINWRWIKHPNDIITANNYAHVAMVFNGSSGDMTLYIDGVNGGTSSHNGFFDNNGNQDIDTFIGARFGSTGPDRFFDGKMMNLTILKGYTMTNEEVNESILVNGYTPDLITPIQEQRNETVVGGFPYQREYNHTQPDIVNVTTNESAVTIGAISSTGFNLTFTPVNEERVYVVSYTTQNSTSHTETFFVTYTIDKFPQWDQSFVGGERIVNTTSFWMGNYTSTWPVNVYANTSAANWTINETLQVVYFEYTPDMLGVEIVRWNVSNTNGSDVQDTTYVIDEAPFWKEQLQDAIVIEGESYTATANFSARHSASVTNNQSGFVSTVDNANKLSVLSWTPSEQGTFYVDITVTTLAGAAILPVNITVIPAPTPAPCTGLTGVSTAVCTLVGGGGEGLGILLATLSTPLVGILLPLGVIGAFLAIFGSIVLIAQKTGRR